MLDKSNKKQVLLQRKKILCKMSVYTNLESLYQMIMLDGGCLGGKLARRHKCRCLHPYHVIKQPNYSFCNKSMIISTDNMQCKTVYVVEKGRGIKIMQLLSCKED